MEVGLASLLQGMVAMLSSVWAMLPVALAVALSSWLWFSRGRKQEELESASPEDSDRCQGEVSPEDGEKQQDSSVDKIAGCERDNIAKFKTTELKVDVQQSPVEQNTAALEAKDDPDAMVKNEKCEQNQHLSNKQNISDAKLKVCENHATLNLIAWPSDVGQLTNASSTEESNYGKETKSTVSIEKVHEKSEHQDEAFDLISAVDQNLNRTDYLNNGDMTDICDSSINTSELNCIKTEIEREDKRKFFQEQINAESERASVSSEPENIARKVAAVSPLPLNNISVNFNVHYITHSSAQFLAVTGNHECLGQWEKYVPLKPNKDGFWCSSILLPVSSKIEWKYVVVEDGKICRWEECLNRLLETGHEDFEIYQCWGYH